MAKRKTVRAEERLSEPAPSFGESFEAWLESQPKAVKELDLAEQVSVWRDERKRASR